VIYCITSIHIRHAPGRTNIHPNVRSPRTADNARVGSECNSSHVGRVGIGSWWEKGVTLVEEGWVRMRSGGVPVVSSRHGCCGEGIGLEGFYTFSG
jgi:hypothetical protein